MNKKKQLDKSQALKKLQRYCAYQDRCHQEVRSKLIELGMYGMDLEEIISDLIGDNFLNEERFAKSYVGGKFRVKHWGRVRIRQELKKRNISAYCIKKGMAEIEEEDYLKTLEHVLTKKRASLKQRDKFKKNGELAKYAMNKGFESNLVWALIKKKWPI